MQNKKYLPSIGFLILLITIVSSALFIKWALGPLSYEEASYEENLGHEFAKDGNAKEASKHFLNAAKIEDDNVSTSRRYRCAGTTASEKKNKIDYYRLALKYNPNNKNAQRELALYFQEIIYVNRYTDGWSMGEIGKAKINATQTSKYKIKYFTSSPKKKEFKVSISLAGKVINEKIIKSGQMNGFDFSLTKGSHELILNINETFNPKKLGMSKDNRDLGVHFEIKKQEVK